MKKYRDIIYIAIIILIGFLFFDKSQELGNTNNNYKAVSDTLSSTRDKLGRQSSKIAAITAKNASVVSQIYSKNGTIDNLKRVVDSLKGRNIKMAAHISSLTKDSSTTETTVTKYDTVYVGSSYSLMPTYRTKWNDRWSKGSIIASYDSIRRDITLFNEYDITTEKKSGLFRETEYVSTIKNMNPNTKTKSFRTFQVTCDCNRWRWALIGGGAGFVTGVLIK